jgi:UDP-N-acetylmuramate--alanine ligase
MTRSAAEIGAGLAAARPARPIRPGERIHVVGAAGAGASAALLLAHHAGAAATGCDPAGHSVYTTAAEALGIVIGDRHDPAHVVADGGAVVDRLAVTKALTAIDPDHAELRAAREAGIPLEPWQQVIADAAVSAGARLVAVAGTHGKSTTSGWLVEVLASAGRDPLAFVGAILPAELTGGLPATARWGSGDVLVAEADEYAGNFDALRPALAILLNAEWDHPDVFADEAAVIDAFEAWIRAAEGSRPSSSPTPRMRASPGCCRVSPTGPAASSPRRSSTSPRNGWPAMREGSARRIRARSVPHGSCSLGRSGRLGGRRSRSMASTARSPSGSGSGCRDVTTPPTRWPSPRPRASSASTRSRSAGDWPASRVSAAVSS